MNRFACFLTIDRMEQQKKIKIIVGLIFVAAALHVGAQFGPREMSYIAYALTFPIVMLAISYSKHRHNASHHNQPAAPVGTTMQQYPPPPPGGTNMPPAHPPVGYTTQQPTYPAGAGHPPPLPGYNTLSYSGQQEVPPPPSYDQVVTSQP